ncbi:MAG TPA: T9SS type A sorting domain-containing protein, partial [Candidatus Kapabacteria bacterium]
ATAEYAAVRSLSSPLLSADTIILSFLPSLPGLRTATLEVTFDNGSTVTIPLSGSAVGRKPLSIATANVGTDTLGANVAVPITIEGLDQPNDVDLSLHYIGSIVYQGSKSLDGTVLDIPGEEEPGRSRLHIRNASSAQIAGYANFIVFDDSLTVESATFDSLHIPGPILPCDYIISEDPAISHITSLSGCDIPFLSRLIHLEESPYLAIVPNPTTGLITLSSDRNLGPATITVIDGLGTERSRIQSDIAANIPLHITLPATAGIYAIRIESASTHSESNIIVIR